MTHNRRGFTLVEIMVAMALTIFILTILAQAFVLGADTFRTLKAVGDLNESLRHAATMLRSDLAADHFEGKRRLSDSRWVNDGPPLQGYFCIYTPPNTPSPTFSIEGVDSDNQPSYRNTGPAILAFTVKAKGNRPQDFFSVPMAAAMPSAGSPDARFQQQGNFNSQWAEVCYFLVPITTASAGGTPLYALYRQQRLVVCDVDQLNWGTAKVPVAQAGLYQNKVSCKTNTQPAFNSFLYFNSPADLTIPPRRTACNFNYPAPPQAPAPLTDSPVGGQPTGEDILIQDVLSFDVKVLLQTGGDFIPMPPSTVPAFGGQTYFDTWSQRRDDMFDYATPNPPNALSVAPSQFNIQAIQITIRIWSPGVKLARQITIVQEM